MIYWLRNNITPVMILILALTLPVIAFGADEPKIAKIVVGKVTKSDGNFFATADITFKVTDANGEASTLNDDLGVIENYIEDTGEFILQLASFTVQWLENDELTFEVSGSGESVTQKVTLDGQGIQAYKDGFGVDPDTNLEFKTAVVSTKVMTLVSGGGQTADINTDLAEKIQIKLTDAGNPASGVAITVTPDDGSGSATFEETATPGTYEATWTLGATVGPQKLTLSATDYNTVEVTATGKEVVVSEKVMKLISGGGQTADINTALAEKIQVTLTDGGNPASGVTITVAPDAGSGSATFSETATPGTYEATWTLGGKLGSQKLTFSATGYNNVVVDATGKGESDMLGDADGNSDINIFDALLVARYDAGMVDAAEINLANANADCSTEATIELRITIYDALKIARFDVGLEGDELTCPAAN